MSFTFGTMGSSVRNFHIFMIINSKSLSPGTIAFRFYFPDLIVVSTDIFLYFRNLKIEKAAEKK